MRLRYKAAPLRLSEAVFRCDQPRMCRVRALFFCLWGLVALALALGFSLSSGESDSDEVLIHIPDLTKDKVRSLAKIYCT